MPPAAQGPRPSSPFAVSLGLLLPSLVPLLCSIRNHWILNSTAVELVLALFPPALLSAARRQPLTAVRRGFQIPGFLLKCFSTSFLRARPHWRGETSGAGELREMPVLWGAGFSSFCAGELSLWQKLRRHRPAGGLCKPPRPDGRLRWPRGLPGSLPGAPSALSSLGTRKPASRPHGPAASAPQHRESWARHRGDGLSPQRLEAATRGPWGHPQTHTQESLESSEAPPCLFHCRGLRRLQETCGRLCAPSVLTHVFSPAPERTPIFLITGLSLIDWLICGFTGSLLHGGFL